MLSREGAWTGNGSMALARCSTLPARPRWRNTWARSATAIKFFEQQAQPLVPFLTQYMPVQASPESAHRQMAENYRRLSSVRRKRTGVHAGRAGGFHCDRYRQDPGARLQAGGRARQRHGLFRPDSQLTWRPALDNRCREVTATHRLRRYARIAGQFNEKLAGKFPFARCQSPIPQAEATRKISPPSIKPWTPIARLRTTRLLEDDTRFGDDGRPARQFLDARGSTTTLGGSGHAGNRKGTSVDAGFRVPNSASTGRNEVGGNQIIDWTMQVGGQIFQQKDPEHAGRWRAGQSRTSFTSLGQ